MKTGDILLIKGKYEIVSWIIRKVIKIDYNHVAWIINSKEIIEATGGGIFIRKINRYSNKFFFKTKILRLKGINTKKLKILLKSIKRKTKKSHYLLLWITYIMLLLKLKIKYPRMTCSGFIACHLSKIGFYFDKRKSPKNITPADILKSRRTYEISNIDASI